MKITQPPLVEMIYKTPVAYFNCKQVRYKTTYVYIQMCSTSVPERLHFRFYWRRAKKPNIAFIQSYNCDWIVLLY